MPNTQRHRGQRSDDADFFNEKWMAVLRKAILDLNYMLSRDYSEKAALKIVGDNYRLNKRQRMALMRASCSDASVIRRSRSSVENNSLQGQKVLIDGYNLLITMESALSRGLVFICSDGCYRDIASVHGTYKRVEETIPALEIIGQNLKSLKAKEIIWYLDAPISNSGRLKKLILEKAQEMQCNWEVNLVNNPDKIIIEENQLVISSDGWILDSVDAWFNFVGYLVENKKIAIESRYLA